MKKQHRNKKGFYRFMIICILLVRAVLTAADVNIHYLGHSCFVLQFGNGISVLTDYGAPNSYGLPGPIYSIGDFVPDVLCISHRHQDHYLESRIPEGIRFVLEGTDTLELDGLSIRSVRTSENDVNVESNTSFIFLYKGLRICHLADAQANIMSVGDSVQAGHICACFPEPFDLLLMTIEGVHPFIPEAEAFVRLLRPARIIPMHYWSLPYRRQFLDYLKERNETAGGNYRIIEAGAAGWSLSASDSGAVPVQVIALDAAPLNIPTAH
ncbi:MBL fold metallo-hydrolase [bacterium]|nr:MBL fold metallo-hydrolase [bacterium]